jgi:hypothetical protein
MLATTYLFTQSKRSQSGHARREKFDPSETARKAVMLQSSEEQNQELRKLCRNAISPKWTTSGSIAYLCFAAAASTLIAYAFCQLIQLLASAFEQTVQSLLKK